MTSPTPGQNAAVRKILGHWSADTTLHMRSALPVDLVAATIIDARQRVPTIAVRPNLITGVPVYVDNSALPGGRRINRAAFASPAAGQSGTLGRNVVRAFASSQVDFSLRRRFQLTEGFRLQFGAGRFQRLEPSQLRSHSDRPPPPPISARPRVC